MSNRKVRRKERKQQFKINSKLKKRLYGDKAFYPCFYCKNVFLVSYLTIEHLIPRCQGGSNCDNNITLACAPCNQEKGREAWLQKKIANARKYELTYRL